VNEITQTGADRAARSDATPTAAPARLRAEVRLGAGTDIGMTRAVNEDCYTAALAPNAPFGGDALLAVADGMGGHNAGEVASEMAISGLRERLCLRGCARAPEAVADAMRRSFEEISRDVFADPRPETRGMGTTLTAAAIIGSRVIIAHVGDSRAYVLRGSHIQQLTTDHSVVAEPVERGVVTTEEARSHPLRNRITRAIGTKPEAQVDTRVCEIGEGDALILCSDGLTNKMSDDEIADLIRKFDPETASRLAIETANERGGEDNITVVIARIGKIAAGAPSLNGARGDITNVDAHWQPKKPLLKRSIDWLFAKLSPLFGRAG